MPGNIQFVQSRLTDNPDPHRQFVPEECIKRKIYLGRAMNRPNFLLFFRKKFHSFSTGSKQVQSYGEKPASLARKFAIKSFGENVVN